LGKYKGSNFFQVSREPFSERSDCAINKLSLSAVKLYLWLHELEHRFSGTKTEDWFYHTNEDLAHITGLGIRSINRAKNQLREQGFIETWQMHWIDSQTGKKSYKHVTAYKIL